MDRYVEAEEMLTAELQCLVVWDVAELRNVSTNAAAAMNY